MAANNFFFMLTSIWKGNNSENVTVFFLFMCIHSDCRCLGESEPLMAYAYMNSLHITQLFQKAPDKKGY